MAIFPHIELEEVVQVNDKTRLNATKSFISKGEEPITLVRIEPEAGAGFVDITGTPIKASNWFLDWEYSTDGTKAVTVEITTDGAPVTETKTIEVLTELDDNQFCKDTDLQALEHDILKWVREGRATFKDVIRRAKRLIMKDLEEFGVVDSNGNKLTEAAIVDKEEVREWATYWSLYLIFNSSNNQAEDILKQKASMYFQKGKDSRTKAYFRYDWNGDGTIELGERMRLSAIEVYRE